MSAEISAYEKQLIRSVKRLLDGGNDSDRDEEPAVTE